MTMPSSEQKGGATDVKTSELLRKARELIEGPESWCQKAFDQGKGDDGQPERFCALGALIWVVSESGSEVNQGLANSARRYLNTSARNERNKLSGGGFERAARDTHTHTICLNDGIEFAHYDTKMREEHSHAAVLRAYDDAIKRATAMGN